MGRPPPVLTVRKITRAAGRLTPAPSVLVATMTLSTLARKPSSMPCFSSSVSPAWWKATPSGSVRASTGSSEHGLPDRRFTSAARPSTTFGAAVSSSA